MIDTPYKGLASFGDTETDALLFFGRERETETIVANVLANRLTVVYGPSGVGKSSVIRAGVAQQLRALGTGVVVVHDSWADHPVESLIESVVDAAPELGPTAGLADTIAAAAHAAGEVYLVLDQFEEYFLYHGVDGPLAGELPELLRRPGVRLNILIALRDDAVAYLDSFTGRAPEIFANLIRLDRLDREAARAAIVGPLARYGELTGGEYGAEPALVDAVLDEVAEGRVDFSGGGEVARDRTRVETPFLQLVLERLWETRDSNVLRLRTFQQLGGAQAIVREHVFGSLDRLPADVRGAAARVVRQLVTPSGAKISHAADDLAEYADVEPDELRQTLDTLLRERIVRGVNGTGTGTTRYEIFHDVLAEPVLAWRQTYEVERERERARRQRRRLWTLVGAAALAVVVLACITVYAFTQRSDARAQARHAHGRQLGAEALASTQTRPARAVGLALRAAQLAPGPDTEAVLRTSLLWLRDVRVIDVGGRVVAASYSPTGTLLVASSSGDVRVGETTIHTSALTHAVWRPDGNAVVLGGEDGSVSMWTTAGKRIAGFDTPAPISVLRYVGNTLVAASGGHVWLDERRFHVRGAVIAADLSPNGKFLAVAERRKDANVTQLFDVSSRHAHVRATLPERGIASVRFSPNGRFLATGSGDRTARLWRVGVWRHPFVIRHRGHVLAEAFSRDGTRVATASDDGTAIVSEVKTGRLQLMLTGATGAAEDVAFAPDGSELGVAFADTNARLYDGVDGHLLTPLAGHKDAVTSVAFSPDGHRVATASDDGTARIWDATDKGALAPLAHARAPMQAEFAGDDVVVGAARDVREVSVHGRELRALAAPAPVRAIVAGGAVLLANGDIVMPTGRGWDVVRNIGATAIDNANGVAWATRDGSVHAGGRTFLVHAPVSALRTSQTRTAVLTSDGRVHLVPGPTIAARADRIALSPDGATLATAHAREATLWNAETGKRIARLRGHTRLVNDVEFSPDGTRIVTASNDHTARTWDAATGRLRHVLRGHFFPVRTASFSPDGRWIVTSSQFTGGLWNATTGERLLYLRGHTKPLTGASFGPDELIVTASEDGTARLFRCYICRTLPGLEEYARTRLAALEARR